jgi:hypothetical protein
MIDHDSREEREAAQRWKDEYEKRRLEHFIITAPVGFGVIHVGTDDSGDLWKSAPAPIIAWGVDRRHNNVEPILVDGYAEGAFIVVDPTGMCHGVDVTYQSVEDWWNEMLTSHNRFKAEEATNG